MDQDVVMSTY